MSGAVGVIAAELHKSGGVRLVSVVSSRTGNIGIAQKVFLN